MSAIPLDIALKLSGEQRPDYLSSLYRYASMLPHPALIVEIGCFLGDSTIMMACALKGTGSHIMTIDPIFQSGKILVIDANSASPGFKESSLIQFLNRISSARLDGYISVIPDYSYSVLERWDGRPIDLLFVDGQHTFSAVKKDVEWMQFVKPGGYSAFDDWMDPVERAVQDYVKEHVEWTILHESTDAPKDNMCVTLLKKK